ncbi:MAG: lysostaphin resistance A-like protein [Thermoanaerobaculia bacterium]
MDIDDAQTRSRGIRCWGYAVLTLAVFLIGIQLIPRAVDAVGPGLQGYARAAAVKTAQSVLAILTVLLVGRAGLRAALTELGLRASLGRALVVAFAATLPMLVGFGVTGTFRTDYSLLVLTVTAVFSPVGEEILFRGFAFGQLYRRARWGFWPAILIPTLFFSLGHLYQAQSVLSALGIFGVTALGSVWFAWLYLRWDNLWVPIALHALMNLWWYVFEVDRTALGGWFANAARIITIVLSIVITLHRNRIWKSEGERLTEQAPAS